MTPKNIYINCVLCNDRVHSMQTIDDVKQLRLCSHNTQTLCTRSQFYIFV